MSFSSFPGTSLYEKPMELRAILALLYSHSLIHTSALGILTITTAVLRRPSDVAVLLNYSLIINIHDCHADRRDDHATCDWEESMYSQRRGKERGECTVYWFLIFFVDFFQNCIFCFFFFFININIYTS